MMFDDAPRGDLARDVDLLRMDRVPGVFLDRRVTLSIAGTSAMRVLFIRRGRGRCALSCVWCVFVAQLTDAQGPIWPRCH
jgi:hypothetical protein